MAPQARIKRQDLMRRIPLQECQGRPPPPLHLPGVHHEAVALVLMMRQRFAWHDRMGVNMEGDDWQRNACELQKHRDGERGAICYG